jgi:type IV secretory pathway TraG/TraD family ATPase VirD4
MVEASAVGLRDVGGNDKVFRDRAAIVLGAYLLAAAIGQKDVVSLLTWTLDRTDDEPATILDGQYPERANNLRQEANMVAETSDAVWMSVRRVVEPLLDDDLRELCSPPPGEGFDAHRFIAAGGSLFLVAGAQEAGPATPLLTALAEYWIETARQMAFSYPTRRLDPPATAVLDEVAGATPIPNLPATVADSAGRGVIIHWAAQSRAQLDEAFGINMAKVLIDTTTLISLWGGLKDDRTLEWASTLCGHYERRRYQSHSEGTFAPGRATLGTETVPVLRPGEIRMIPRREVVIVYRTLGPIRARTQDVSDRPDWPAIRADIDTIRQGGIRTADADSDRARSYPVHPLPAPTFDPGYGSGRGAGSGWQ